MINNDISHFKGYESKDRELNEIEGTNTALL